MIADPLVHLDCKASLAHKVQQVLQVPRESVVLRDPRVNKETLVLWAVLVKPVHLVFKGLLVPKAAEANLETKEIKV